VAISISAARAGLKTVLVDADTRRSAVASMLNAAAKLVESPTLGLDKGFELRRYDCGGFGLDVLEVGSGSSPQPDIIAGPPFENLLSELMARYDLVILDTPPILAVSDPLAIARWVDETLLVIDAQATRKDVVLEALKPVRAIGCRLTGVILNKATDSEIYLQYSHAIRSYYLEDAKARDELQAIADPRHRLS
jgi:Mrp family chromosome partitioning ATPase